MFTKILIGAAVTVIFLCCVYIIGKVIMSAWLDTIENYLLNKSKKKKNEQKEKK